MAYKARKCSKRWLDGDCPSGILAILDHPNCFDRYTVIYSAPICGTEFRDTVFGFHSMSSNPFSPQGVGLYGEMDAYQVSSYRYSNKHRYCKWSSLPDLVKKCVLQSLAE